MSSMKCRKCQYPLWNLSEPRCPECGEGFDLLGYWFEPGSVVFKCPYCQHRHLGRDARGLPFDAGQCEGCGKMLVVEQMAVEPVDGKMETAVRTDQEMSRATETGATERRRAAMASIIAAIICIAVVILVLVLRNL